jgi:nitroreductase
VNERDRLITSRRSVPRVRPDEVPRHLVEEILAAAVTAPNHRLTRPWRFIVLAGAARREIGEAHLRAVLVTTPDLGPERREREASRLERAPVVIACVARSAVDADEITRREDRDAVAAAIQNVLLAAHGRGLGAMWRTGAIVDEVDVHQALALERGDAIVAFVYVGWPAGDVTQRPAGGDDLEAVVQWRTTGA